MPGVRLVIIEDPDGNWVEFVQRERDRLSGAPPPPLPAQACAMTARPTCQIQNRRVRGIVRRSQDRRADRARQNECGSGISHARRSGAVAWRPKRVGCTWEVRSLGGFTERSADHDRRGAVSAAVRDGRGRRVSAYPDAGPRTCPRVVASSCTGTTQVPWRACPAVRRCSLVSTPPCTESPRPVA